MNSKIKMLIIGSMGMIFSGCASKYPVTFDSNPAGASLICSGKNWGYTPKTLYYDKEVKKLTSLNISSCSANWVSGARKDYGTVPVQQYPNGVRQTLQRPNVEGYATDAQFALQVQNMKYQQRQAEAAEDAAYQQRRNANANKKQANELNNINNYLRYGY